jgi:hypothetical protein
VLVLDSRAFSRLRVDAEQCPLHLAWDLVNLLTGGGGDCYNFQSHFVMHACEKSFHAYGAQMTGTEGCDENVVD